jgi:amino acid adenylation domain-containing protein
MTTNGGSIDATAPQVFVLDRRLRQQRDYWLARLQACGEPPGIELDFPRREGAAQPETHLFDLPRPTLETLRALTGGDAFLTYVVLAAIAGICLHKYTGATSLVLGSPARGGPANALAIALELDPDRRFQDLLLDSRQALLDAYANQDYPYAALARDLRGKRVGEPRPLFQLAVVHTAIHSELAAVGNDLTFCFTPRADGLHGSIRFDQRLFQKARIQRLAAHFVHLLELALDDPGRTPNAMKMLTPAERRLALEAWQGPRIAHDTDASLAEAFVARVQASPDVTAVVFSGVGLSYRQLDQRANRLAVRLRLAGVGVGSRVVLLGDRSIETIVGMLAILKLGAAYVPIDPSYPLARITFMIRDSGSQLLLGTAAHLPEGIDSCGVEVLDLGEAEPEGIAADDPGVVVDAGSLAYVLYTSGTTGEPKGVCVTQRNICNLVRGLEERIYRELPAAPLKVGLVAPFVFDASVQQIFASLLGGHTLVGIPKQACADGERLLGFLAREAIDVCDGTPAHLRLILEAKGDFGALSLRRWLLGGEALDKELVKAFFERCGDDPPVVCNMYGVTECCVDTLVHVVTPDTIDLHDRLPIGTPLANQAAFVLDRAGDPLPIGVTGELWLGGDGVGGGYTTTDSTAVFVDDPELGGRLYRTGDLGRYLDDGSIACAGRIDRQVKIRGYRIEPGEIEAILRQFRRTTRQPLAPGDTRERQPLGIHAVNRCARCVLTDAAPGVTLDAQGVCNLCREFDEYRAQAQRYFQTPRELDALVQRARALNTGAYDCMLLYSGGKDSSYVLYRLLDMGLRVLAFTFDNGFISPAAFANIERITEKHGVDSVIATAPRMNDMFVESLSREDTVCSGCFKALTNLSTRMAHERGIHLVLTGLSRGQIIETKLQGLFRQGVFGSEAIEEQLRLYRRIYHSRDRYAELLGDDLGDVALDRMFFADFFRYDATPVTAIREELRRRDSHWATPRDTGFCSSNCMINDVGICVHSTNRSYHNYDAPVSWDVRLGLVDRSDALEEVRYEINYPRVNSILRTIGYFEKRITDAFVVAQEIGGERDLGAYFVSNQEISVAELREHLLARVPEYMVPRYFIRLTELPLSVNGKVDRSVLPPAKTHALGRGTDDADLPDDDMERGLLEIWRELLDLERIRTDQHFFEIGGQSLRATQLAARIRRQYGVALEVRDIFEHPTIERLALSIRERRRAAFEPIPSAPDMPHYPLSSAQLRFWLTSQDRGRAGVNTVTIAVRLAGAVDPTVFEDALGDVIERHESLRTVIVMVDQQPRQRALPAADAKLRLALVDLAQATEREEKLFELVRRSTAVCFDLAVGPLLQATLIALADDDHVLLLALHHIVSDGWSLRIIERELLAAYVARLHGREPPRCRPSIQYKDFSVWQAGQLQSPAAAAAREHWLGQLAGAVPLALATDFERPPRKGTVGRALAFEMSAQTVARLELVARRHQATMYMVLLTCLELLLHKYTGATDVTIGSPVAGRSHPDLEDQVGAYLNLLALRCRVDERDTLGTVLDRARDTALEAYRHQDYPFECVVRDLSRSPDPSRNPLFDVGFTLQNQIRPDASPPAGLPFAVSELSVPEQPVGLPTDLWFLALQTQERIEWRVVYDAQLFAPASMHRLWSSLLRIADALGSDDGVLVGDLQLLSPRVEPARPVTAHLDI